MIQGEKYWASVSPETGNMGALCTVYVLVTFLCVTSYLQKILIPLRVGGKHSSDRISLLGTYAGPSLCSPPAFHSKALSSTGGPRCHVVTGLTSAHRLASPRPSPGSPMNLSSLWLLHRKKCAQALTAGSYYLSRCQTLALTSTGRDHGGSLCQQ